MISFLSSGQYSFYKEGIRHIDLVHIHLQGGHNAYLANIHLEGRHCAYLANFHL